ncbi:hypothetical protein BDW22DRAFT_1392747 [Trametopsis cervina]|nr:hypothetical protein BDW22DRAFT_1392747 [Trametopsis cervina]
MSSAPRKQAPRIARPAARYWKGKVPKGVDAVASDSDEDDEGEVQEGDEEGDVLIRDVGADEDGQEDEDGLEVKAAARKAKAGINVALRDVNISKEGKVIVAGREEVGRTEAELEEEEEDEEEEEAEEEEEESEEESESESEDEPPKPQFRPVFVPKRGRATVAEEAALAQYTEEAQKRKEAEAEERRKQSHDLVAESIRRELAEKEKEAEVPDVDDTDGLNPEEEFEAWRLRELARIKRDKEDEVRRELEREEIERRRALPEEQRLKEDMEHAEKSRAEKPKGQQKFLQKYWHKGAFHQDVEILQRHDFTEATESTVDVSMLPKVMQVKNFGKRGRTKYTHLLDQDTTASTGGFGGAAPVKSGGTSTAAAGGGCFLCGGPHLKKDCPQNNNLPPNRIGTGANSTSFGGTREWGTRKDGEGASGKGLWRDREEGGGRDPREERGDWRDDRERYDRRERPDERDGGRGGRGRYDRQYDDRGPRRPSPGGDRRRDERRRHSRSRSRERSADHARDEKRRRIAIFLTAPDKHTIILAVIGSGLGGLTAAYRLARTPRGRDVEFEVHVFEKTSSLGMDAHSVSIALQDEKPERRIDVPMRSFQGGYYPHLISLYKHIGVRFRKADFTYAFATLTSPSSAPPLHKTNASQRRISTFMIYNGASGRSGMSVPSSYYPSSSADHKYPSLVDTLAAILLPTALTSLLSHLLRTSLRLIPLPVRPPPETTFRQWVSLTTPSSPVSKWAGLDRLWEEFASDILVPLFSAVCTAPEGVIWDHPVEEFLDYVFLTIGTHHYVVEDGVRDVVRRLSAPLSQANVHLSTPVLALVHNRDSSTPGGEATIDIHSTSHTVFRGFHHVILATQANHARSILQTYHDTIPSPNTLASSLANHRAAVAQQLHNLAAFSYVPTLVVNHTDNTLLPDAPRDTRDLNLIMAHPSLRAIPSAGDKTGACVPPDYAMATHVLASFGHGSKPVYQTTNPVVPVAPDAVLSVARLERAVVSVQGKEALRTLWRESEDDSRQDEGVWGLKWGCAVQTKGMLGPLQGACSTGEKEEGRTPRIWLCGSYAYGGIPLLEGCVVSAGNVVEQGVWPTEGIEVGRERGEFSW